LGTEIVRVFGESVVALTHDSIEISDQAGSREIIEAWQPQVLINTAAYHNVIDCEKNPQTAFSINGIAVKQLADICRDNNIKFVHVSTDYVFDGRKNQPYDEEDAPFPLNVYGNSKLAGEFFAKANDNHYIVRVSSLFGKVGCRAKGGANFVKTMLHLARTRDSVLVTSNIFISPTYAYDAALKIKELVEADLPSGTYHISNGGSCSWYEFALEIFRLIGSPIKVEKKLENEELEGIRRPLYSALSSHKTKPLRHWKDALRAYLRDENVTIKEDVHD
jgi:dTDP-4-dehydrorhamnose reductase